MNGTTKALRLIGMSLRARRLEVGFDSTLGLVVSGRARLVVVASDASERVRSKLGELCEEAGVRYVEASFDKFALGAALGRAECAAVGTSDAGFSKSITAALGDMDNGNNIRR